jgi:hypothetical protein
VYVALCYYKLDYYDVSLEILSAYLTNHEDSAIAINLKACNHYKLYDGKAAEGELKSMMDVMSSSSQVELHPLKTCVHHIQINTRRTSKTICCGTILWCLERATTRCK